MRSRYAFVFLLAIPAFSHAEHFAGGTITSRCLGGNFHEITLQLFRNCSGTALLPQDLGFANDCGVIFEVPGLTPESTVEVSPLCESDIPNSTCNGGSLLGFDLTTYRTTVFLSPCDRWRISWNTCCRNASLNLVGAPGLYIETILNNADGSCNAAPEFVNNSVPLVCVDQPVSHDASATEPDGNILRYRLIDARFGTPDPQVVQYASGYSGEEPFTGMEIDSLTGTITFLPTLAGVIITAVEVSERNSEGALIGTVMRDFLFYVSPCANTAPSLESGVFGETEGPVEVIGDRSLRACIDATFCASLDFTDVNITQTITLTTDVADVLPGATMSVIGTNPVEAELCWTATGVEPGTYSFSITATDDACPILGVQQFDYSITIGTSASAGEDGTVNSCLNDPPFQLINHLNGEPAITGQWTDDTGQPFSGIYVPGSSSPGTYTYTITGTDGCTSSAEVVVIDLDPGEPECLMAAVQERSAFDLRVVQHADDPHAFQISSSTTRSVSLTIIGADGRVEHEVRPVIGPIATVVDVRSLAGGIHLFRVADLDSGERRTVKIVVP